MDNGNMRVAMLSFHTCPLATLGGKDTGGMNVYVQELTKELGRQGVGVDVFTRSQDEHVPHVLHDLGYGNRVVHIPAGPETPQSKTILHAYIPEYVKNILEFQRAKSITYDLIHSHYWMSGVAGLLLQESWKVPVVQMFHTLAEMKKRVARTPEEIESEVRFEEEQRLMDQVNGIIVSTEAELAQMRWLYRIDPSHVGIIPPGVDTSRFYPIDTDEAKEFIQIPPDRRMVLFVGRIEPLKGVDSVLKALKVVLGNIDPDRYDLHLSIIGGDPETQADDPSPEMARLISLVEELGLSRCVEFLGKQSQVRLPYYYSAAEFLVMPSYYESFGMVALEAMACGTPVIAAETGGLAFLVRDGETGFHIPTGSHEALAEKMQILVENKLLLDEMGKLAATHAAEYSWPTITRRVIEFFDSCF
jgi:D-inositol-3-phosphate glycosyltransferase